MRSIRYMDFDSVTALNAHFLQSQREIISIETVHIATRNVFRVWFKE